MVGSFGGVVKTVGHLAELGFALFGKAFEVRHRQGIKHPVKKPAAGHGGYSRRIGSSSIGDKSEMGKIFHVGLLEVYCFRNGNDGEKKLKNDLELVNQKMA